MGPIRPHWSRGNLLSIFLLWTFFFSISHFHLLTFIVHSTSSQLVAIHAQPYYDNLWHSGLDGKIDLMYFLAPRNFFRSHFHRPINSCSRPSVPKPSTIYITFLRLFNTQVDNHILDIVRSGRMNKGLDSPSNPPCCRRLQCDSGTI
ncbi:hypothetical protein F4859DRAFT_65560 [Xylaria cf. heliscus]|nr:hypothetical protein F4859DRAFT_65560 [Xylaria cf. heliscus]